MHGGTQTIRFWGLQHVHWREGSCCWFLRLQSRLVWDVPKALQGRQGMCGSLAGWFQVAIQAVDWFVPEHHLSIGLRCRFCEVHRRLLMHGGTQTIRFWGLQHVHWCEGSCCWFLRLQSRLVWDVPKALQGRQGMCGSLAGWFQVAIQAVDWCSRASSIYWFKVSRPEGLGKLMMLSAKEEKGKTFEKIEIHLISKKTQLSWESKLKAQTSLFDPV